jgi:hypothetical protein
MKSATMVILLVFTEEDRPLIAGAWLVVGIVCSSLAETPGGATTLEVTTALRSAILPSMNPSESRTKWWGYSFEASDTDSKTRGLRFACSVGSEIKKEQWYRLQVQTGSSLLLFTPAGTLFKSGTVHRWNLNPMPMGMNSGTKKQFSKYTMKVPPTSTTAKVSGTVV